MYNFGNMPSNSFHGREQQDVLRVELEDGTSLTGSYLSQAGMHFLHVRHKPHDKVEGPIDADRVTSITVLQTREEVFNERYARSRGALHPGPRPATREDHQYRLESIAQAAASADTMRRLQLEQQFNDVADAIGLARTKRNWMLAAAALARHSNREPSRLDFAGGDLTMAAKFVRPRPQDFDPDPIQRRKRPRLPNHVANDPRSVPNMIKALRRAGFRARPSILGETDLDRADLLVDFREGKMAGRFQIGAVRRPDGSMNWSVPRWEGGDTKTGMRRARKARASNEFRLLLDTLSRGLYHGPRSAEDPGQETAPKC